MKRRHRKNLPTVWLMTDERMTEPALFRAVSRLPAGRGGIVFRHYRTVSADRRALFARLKAIARRRRLILMLAGSAREAVAWRADGWHGRGGGAARRPLLHSAPVHDLREVQVARRGQADFIFLSPLFATRSHPGARPLGRVRFAALAQQAGQPVIALGGVVARHRLLLRRLGAYGWAAIDGLG